MSASRAGRISATRCSFATTSAHPESAAAYAGLKRALADLGIDRGRYADVKDPACDLIFVAAEDWASETGWLQSVNMRIFIE